MTSQIIRTNPTAGTATTSSVRDNFGFAADEINVLQRSSTELKLTTGGGANPYNVNFGSSPVFSLVDGVRISVRINATNDGSANIIVAPGNTPIPIVKTDNSSLLAGDLVEDSIYDLIYNANSSLGYPVWIGLNIDTITSQDTLLTTILGGLYPVGSLLTTTNSANPGDADYFFSGITFGTWEAYAQGRTIVGIDTGFGTGFVSGSAILGQITIVIAEKALSKGDSITVSGFTGTSTIANGSHTVDSAVTAAGQTTVIYTVVDTTELASLVGTDVKVINEAFDTSQEIGGESNHQLTAEEMAQHRHHQFVISSQSSQNYISGDSKFSAAYHFSRGGDDNRYIIARPVGDDYSNPTHAPTSNMIDARTGTGSGSDADVTGDVPHNNLQPYITTYIWKRTA